MTCFHALDVERAALTCSRLLSGSHFWLCAFGCGGLGYGPHAESKVHMHPHVKKAGLLLTAFFCIFINST